MADNVAITPGSGTTVATDDVAGVHYPLVKLADGTVDSGTVIAAGGGVEADALRVTLASDSTGVLAAVGDVAHDAVDSGEPLKIGGKARSAPDAVATGKRVDGWVGVNGQFIVGPWRSATDGHILPPGTFLNASGAETTWPAAGMLWDPAAAKWHYARTNHAVTALASAARTASVQSADIPTHNARGIIAIIDVTAFAATPSVVFDVQGKDSIPGTYWDILSSAAIIGTGKTVLQFAPGMSAAANSRADSLVPATIRINATAADADSITYSVNIILVN